MEPTATYRKDIDGLRSIAVLLVVFYHFGMGPSGGFIGVDVFFVISGYLITSILVRELRQNGRFSILSFYERRVRRIFPALIAVIVTSLVAGWFLLMPEDYEALGWQAATASFGASNFYFLFNSGYFDLAAETLPLLHTWSLAVEEQFYFVWPVILAVIWKLTRGSIFAVVLALVAIIAISLGWSIYEVGRDQNVAFYMLHTRAWELAIGAILAFAPSIRWRPIAEIMPAIGLCLIGWSSWQLSSESVFPGVNALAPCVGAALVVWPRQHEGFVSRLLSLRPLVFVGLLSYSLYLWHWPVVVFYTHYNNGIPPEPAISWGLVGLSVLLSYLSWRYVEQPARHLAVRPRLSLGAGYSAAALVAVLGILIVVNAGVFARLPAQAAVFLDRSLNKGGYTKPGCGINGERDGPESYDFESCLVLSPDKPDVLLMGDSHAAHFVQAMEEAFPTINLIQLTASGCRPLLAPEGHEGCKRFHRISYGEVVVENRFDAIILSGRWRGNDDENIRESAEYLTRFTDRVVVLGPTIEYSTGLPKLLAKASFLPNGRELLDNTTRDSAIGKRDQLFAELLSDLEGVKYFSILDIICPGTRPYSCIRHIDGIPTSYDYGHFSLVGARFVVDQLEHGGILSEVD